MKFQLQMMLLIQKISLIRLKTMKILLSNSKDIELGNTGDVSKAVESLQDDFSEVNNLTTDALENRFENLLGKNPHSGTQAVVKAFSIFMHDMWPTERGPILLYECKELDTIVGWFTQPLLDAGCEITKLSHEWRKLKLTVTANFQNNHTMNCINCY